MAEKFDEFMEEVENDIRQEKYMKLWQQYGKQITAAITVALIGIIGYNLWSQYDYRQRSKNSDIMIGAQDYMAMNRHGEALSALKTLGDKAVAPYNVLSRLNEAAILSIGEAEQKQEAIKIYQDLIAMHGVDKAWQDVALYNKIALQSNMADTNWDSLLTELNVIDLETSPIAALIKELKAAILLQKGDKAQAGEIFVKLVQDKNAPSGVAMRSQLMAQIISSN